MNMLDKSGRPADASIFYDWRLGGATVNILFSNAPNWVRYDGGMAFEADVFEGAVISDRVTIWVHRERVVDEDHDTYLHFDGDAVGMPGRDDVVECHGKLATNGAGWLWYGRLREIGPYKNM